MARFKFQGTAVDQRGFIMSEETVTVSLTGTATVATIYVSEAGAAISGGVITTGTDGSFDFWVDDGDYASTQRFRVSVSGDKFVTRVYDDIDVFPGITLTGTELLSNKTLEDSTTGIVDDGDNTKVLRFQCSGITTATTRTLTVPDASDTLVLLGEAQTLTSKTLTTPVVGDLTNMTHNHDGASGGGEMTSPVMNTSVSGTAVLDEDAMGSDSATQVATQQSIKAYVDSNTITLGTEQASTSGTAIDFTGIPSGVQKITVMFVGVSWDGTKDLLVQIGDAGGIEATGYKSAAGFSSGNTASTVGFIATGSSAAAGTYDGNVTLTLEDAAGFTWTQQSVVCRTDSALGNSGGGSKSLSAELTQVRITTTGTPDDFDLGAINIQYE